MQCEGRPHAECRTDALNRTTADRGKWSRGEKGEVGGSAAASVARYRGSGMGEQDHGFAPVAMICHPYRGWRRAAGREEHPMSTPASLQEPCRGRKGMFHFQGWERRRIWRRESGIRKQELVEERFNPGRGDENIATGVNPWSLNRKDGTPAGVMEAVGARPASGILPGPLPGTEQLNREQDRAGNRIAAPSVLAPSGRDGRLPRWIGAIACPATFGD